MLGARLQDAVKAVVGKWTGEAQEGPSRTSTLDIGRIDEQGARMRIASVTPTGLRAAGIVALLGGDTHAAALHKFQPAPEMDATASIDPSAGVKRLFQLEDSLA